MISLKTWVNEDPHNGNAYYASVIFPNGISIDLYQSEIPNSIQFPEYGRIELSPFQAEEISPGCMDENPIQDKKGVFYFNTIKGGMVNEYGDRIRFDKTTGRLWYINEKGEETGFEEVDNETEKA